MTQSEYPNYERHRRQRDDDFSNIQLRFYLAKVLHRMRYGETRTVSQDQAMRAWPPTGDHAPRTLENDFRALSLARGGHRPETSYTTQERIINDLDETFDVSQNIVSGDWNIHRRARECPKCHGRKYMQSIESASFSVASLDEMPEAESVRAIKTEACDCKPKPLTA